MKRHFKSHFDYFFFFLLLLKLEKNYKHLKIKKTTTIKSCIYNIYILQNNLEQI